MRKVELLLLPGTMRAVPSPEESITMRGMSASWLGDQVELLRDEAGELRSVIVSVRRVSWNHAWSVQEEMGALLRPLEVLRGRVQFRVGEVMGPRDLEGKMLRALERVVEVFNV